MSHQESKQISQEMARIRRELDHDVEAVVEGAKALTDWRGFVRRHPLLTASAATAVGYLLVPHRREVMRPSANTLKTLAKQERLVVEPSAAVNRGGVVRPLVNVIGGALMRSALTMVGQQISKSVNAASSPNTDVTMTN